MHLVEPSPSDLSDPLDNYAQIREELRLYDPSLAERPEILVVTKAELTDAETCAELLRETTGREVLLVSAVTGRGLPELNRQIIQRLAELKAADAVVATDVGAATAPAVSEPPLERPE